MARIEDHRTSDAAGGRSFTGVPSGAAEPRLSDHVLVPGRDLIDSPSNGPDRVHVPSKGSVVYQSTPFDRTDDKRTSTELSSSSHETEPREVVDDRCDSTASLSCEYLIYRSPDTLAHRHSYTDRRIVEIKVFWIDSRRSPTASVPLSLDERGRLVVQRITPSTPEGEAAWVLPTHPSPTGESHDDDSTAGRLRDALADWATKKVVDPTWEKSVECWETPEYENLASAAENFSKLHDQLHHLAVGQPIESLTGLEPLGDIAAEITLPGDGLIASVKCFVLGGGIMLGLISGQPLLANGCLKALIHDATFKVVSKVVSKKARDFFTNLD
jgi:hypothetical protein